MLSSFIIKLIESPLKSKLPVGGVVPDAGSKKPMPLKYFLTLLSISLSFKRDSV